MSNVNNTVSVNTAQILQGAGKIEFGGVLLGSFRDGITVTVTTEYAYTRSDYAIGEIDSEATGATCEVNTTLEEGTVRNWCIALGGNTSSSSSSSSSIIWDFGPEMAQNPQALKFLVMSEKDKTQYRQAEFFRAQRIGSTATSFKRGAEVLFPITWKCFLNTDSKFFRITDPVADIV
jgi:hypothetical protein